MNQKVNAKEAYLKGLGDLYHVSLHHYGPLEDAEAHLIRPENGIDNKVEGTQLLQGAGTIPDLLTVIELVNREVFNKTISSFLNFVLLYFS